MKYSVRFNMHPKRSDGNDRRAFVKVRVSWAGIRADALTGLQVLPEYWDAEGQRAKPSYRFGKETGASINKQLAGIVAHFDQFFSKFHLEGTVPTLADVRHDLKTFFGTGTDGKTCVSIFDCIDLFVESQKEQNGWTNGTATKFRTLKKHLHGFSHRLDFADLDENGLQRFMQYMLNNGIRNVTIGKYLDFLRWFLRWAVMHGYSDKTDFETFRPKLKGTDGNLKEIIYLEWDELMRLSSYDFGERHQGLSAVRDVFCFCCFTGLRYSDVARLRASDIHHDHISIVTQKTADGLVIELNDHSSKILEKYRNFREDQDNKTHRAFPVISNQKMNTYLKEIGELLCFDTPIRIVYYRGSKRCDFVFKKYELLTTHCARRTFVVNALRLGIPAEVIMKWTGHSSFSSMKPYVKIVDELKQREMAKFNTGK